MKRFLLIFLFSTSTFASMLTNLSPAGCEFVATVSACITDENKGKVEEGYCLNASKNFLSNQKEMLPDYKFDMIEDLVAQEANKIKLHKSKDAQKVYNSFIEKCYKASGDIKTLLNKGV